MLIQEKQISLVNEFAANLCWENARVWAYWNHLDMHQSLSRSQYPALFSILNCLSMHSVGGRGLAAVVDDLIATASFVYYRQLLLIPKRQINIFLRSGTRCSSQMFFALTKQSRVRANNPHNQPVMLRQVKLQHNSSAELQRAI